MLLYPEILYIFTVQTYCLRRFLSQSSKLQAMAYQKNSIPHQSLNVSNKQLCGCTKFVIFLRCTKGRGLFGRNRYGGILCNFLHRNLSWREIDGILWSSFPSDKHVPTGKHRSRQIGCDSRKRERRSSATEINNYQTRVIREIETAI